MGVPWVPAQSRSRAGVICSELQPPPPSISRARGPLPSRVPPRRGGPQPTGPGGPWRPGRAAGSRACHGPEKGWRISCAARRGGRRRVRSAPASMQHLKGEHHGRRNTTRVDGPCRRFRCASRPGPPSRHARFGRIRPHGGAGHYGGGRDAGSALIGAARRGGDGHWKRKGPHMGPCGVGSPEPDAGGPRPGSPGGISR